MKYLIVESKSNYNVLSSHRTLAVAEKELEKQQRQYCQHCGRAKHQNWGQTCKCWSPVTSARYYNAYIAESED